MKNLGIGILSLLLVSVAACVCQPSDSEESVDGTLLQDALTQAKGSCAQAPVALGSAATFAVLAGSTVTNTGPTTVIGDLGVSPGTAVSGFLPGKVVGTQHLGDPTAAKAEAALTVAYNDAAGRTLC